MPGPFFNLYARLAVPRPFDLELAVFGHGWIDLEPHGWEVTTRTFSTVLATSEGPADVAVRESGPGLALRIRSHRPLPRPERARVRARVARGLRLDEDLTPFWAQCRAVPRLRWVARRGAGRMLRSASLFEDLLKLLLTTNCAWSATRRMNTRLVEALGEPAPSGRKAFPGAEACARHDEAFWRNEVRAGYRAKACTALARAFAEGALTEAWFDEPSLDARAVRERLLELPGFGPYAAGQAMRLLGRHDELALDSWCRGRLAALDGRARPPSDAAVARRYRAFGRYQGLALWMDLTADWHRGRKAHPWDA